MFYGSRQGPRGGLFAGWLRSAALALLLSSPAAATGIIPLAGTQQFDKDASPPAYLVGGLVDIYLAGTTTPASIFSDFTLTTPLANPLTLNTAGRFPPVYVADGAYRVRIRSSVGVLQFDDDNLAAVTAAISTTPIVVTPDQLWSFADVKIRFDDQVVSGYVRCNGRTIGSATSGAAERASSDTENLFKFLWTFANVSVVTGKGASAAADWSANKQLTLPDCAGRMLAGRDDLGGGVKSRITAATITGPTVVGAAGGAETVTLDTTMVPAHTHPSPAVTDPGHFHFTVNSDISGGGISGTNSVNLSANFGTDSSYILNATATTPSGGKTDTKTTGITLAATSGSTGGGLAHSNMPPVMLFTIYLKL